jgi:rhomboid protease GluP
VEDQQDARERDDSGASTSRESSEVAAPIETFDVRFQIARSRQYGRAGPARFQGKGRIAVQDTRIDFEGKSRRISWLAKQEAIVVAPSDVFNVERLGKALRFHLRSNTGTFCSIDLTAANAAEASRLQLRLSKEKTPEFAVAVAERSDFYARLDQLSPHAPVVPALVVINVVLFIAMCIAGIGIFSPDGEAVVRWGSNFGPLTTNGQWWRLLSNTFIHFGLLHIAFNMWALYASGRTVERLFGSGRFVVLYLFAGIAGSMASLLWNPQVNSAGASGAIFGVFGGMLAFVLNPRNAVPRSVMVEHRNSTLAFAAYSLFYGLAHTGIDNAAHIGGLTAGLAMGFLLARPLTSEARSAPRPVGLALALCFGAMALFALSWPLVHPSAHALRERQFGAVRAHLSDDEAAAIAASKQLSQHVSAGRSSRQQLAAELARDVTPKWNALYEKVAAVPLETGDSDYELQHLLLRYFDARRKQFSLGEQAMLTNDPSIGQQAVAKANEADQAIAEMKAMQERHR